MTHPSALIQRHAQTIISTLAEILDAPDLHDRLEAAKLLLIWGWGPAGKACGATPVNDVPAGRLSPAQQQRAVDLLLAHLEPGGKEPNPATTSCPARQVHPRAEPATNSMSAEREAPAPRGTTGAKRATTPCPAAALPAPEPAPAPDPIIDPVSREPPASPLAAPPGTDSRHGSPTLCPVHCCPLATVPMWPSAGACRCSRMSSHPGRKRGRVSACPTGTGAGGEDATARCPTVAGNAHAARRSAWPGRPARPRRARWRPGGRAW